MILFFHSYFWVFFFKSEAVKKKREDEKKSTKKNVAMASFFSDVKMKAVIMCCSVIIKLMIEQIGSFVDNWNRFNQFAVNPIIFGWHSNPIQCLTVMVSMHIINLLIQVSIQLLKICKICQQQCLKPHSLINNINAYSVDENNDLITLINRYNFCYCYIS